MSRAEEIARAEQDPDDRRRPATARRRRHHGRRIRGATIVLAYVDEASLTRREIEEMVHMINARHPVEVA